ncbi:MAG: hypothetical protein ACR2M8_10900 [Pyrinomonadaceae bacterium]|nr:hypothetical protein [Blastocatellia bacterium]MDQ3221467.1 hypothetical protein [Acidobacteriota bacterium]
MKELSSRNDVSGKELARGRNLKVAAWSAPLILAGIPAAVFLILLFIFGTTPPVAATIFFLGIILTIIGFVSGLIVSGVMAHKHSKWTKEMRERIAARGIRAEEISWFNNELRPNEKRALKGIESSDPMLADAYRETLASRLTATRIVRSSKHELLLTQRRQAKLKYLKSDKSEEFQSQIKRDAKKIGAINDEAKLMLNEAETRLQMIEAAAARGGSLADSEIALKKLSARSAELPLALEEARMAEEIRMELDKESG